MDCCDVLIVGGGPAGSTCARALVREGLRVVLLDRATFPRGKPCAGWITPQVVEELELDLDHYARQHTLQPFTGFSAGIIAGPSSCIRYPAAVSYGIRRLEFDHFLLARSGAHVFMDTPFMTAMRRNGEWHVNGRWRAPFLVGAGGHACPVARLLGAEVGRAEQPFCAREAEFLMDRQLALHCRVNPALGELYFCDDLAGYGWCLRKGNYLNIGLGREGAEGLAADLARLLQQLVGSGHVPLTAPPRFRGHAYLAWENSQRPLTGPGCLLAGDAAGLASAHSGEGIRRAVESGLLAARTLVESLGTPLQTDLHPYAARLAARFGPRRRAMSAVAPPGRAARTAPPGLIDRWRQGLGRHLLSAPPFLRHVVLDRYFLQRAEPALPRATKASPLEYSA